MREKEMYRDNLEMLKVKFPEKDILTLKDVCNHLSVERRTAISSVPFKRLGAKYFIPITNFAKWLS